MAQRQTSAKTDGRHDMATDKQLAANRQNALMSTGPRSLAGKTRSRFNAVRHGLTATQAMLPGEDQSEFAALRAAMFTSLSPEGVLQNQLVERAASLIWRMRRVPAFEVALLEWTAYYQAARYDGGVPSAELGNDPDNLQPIGDLQDGLKLGRVVETLLSSDLVSKLGRYETAMQRQLTMTLHELRELQRPRREFEKTIEQEQAKEKAKAGRHDPREEAAYYAELDRQRMLRMDPP